MTDQHPGRTETDPDADIGTVIDSGSDPDAPSRTGTSFSRRTVLAAGIPAVAGVLAITALSGPRPARLGEPTGDEQVTAALQPHLSGHRRVAIAYLDGSGTTRFGGFGAEATDEFEVGSVTKTFTGALLASAVERGEVTVQSTVADVLGDEAEGSAIADVTLAELATHTSGIPSLAPSWWTGRFTGTLLRQDPYPARDGDEVIADALGITPNGRGSYAYSNLGVALQGQLLARAAGTDYATLLGDRILEPLSLASTYAPITPEGLRDTATRGHTSAGLPNAAWTMHGVAPAGGIRSTAEDLALYLTGMIEGTAPGASAATEVLFTESQSSETSMNWFHEDVGTGQLMTWHNGMTGGFAAFTGWDPSTGRGIVLLTDTARSLDDVAVAVLTGEVEL
ncbi:serine hydrolase domain-containing protein [Brachybacterium sp. GCM10030268]|uniref:serine hydrolase domain-containing protein n=1 Tax=Brachybacterium sp. GCM10030268 TaxID=3273382 RepID=UPI003619ABA3